jgi:hypothetical protein
MITMILPAVLATTLFLTTSYATPTPAPQIVFTRVLPEKNLVSYVVRKNDTLKIIAKNYYKDENYWKNILNDNPAIKDPDNLENGSKIKLSSDKTLTPEQLTQDLQAKNDDLQKEKAQQIYYNSLTYSYSAQTSAVNSSVSPSPISSPNSSYDDVYKQAGAKYGVPWQILYGIHMTETGGRNGAIFSGYGTGAQGPMQFMPGTFRAYAVDGKNDINNADDSIYAAANFIAKHGSVDAALRSYGGNNAGVIQLARARGFNE